MRRAPSVALAAGACSACDARVCCSIGSRHVEGGGLGFDWSLLRQAISAVATGLCRPLTSCTDPMSGFFCTTKEVPLTKHTPCAVSLSV